MKEKKPKNILGFLKNTDERYIAAFTIFVYIILLIPTIYLGKYNFMKADDFSFGRLPHKAYVETGSYFESLKAGIDVVKESYLTWQGTYSSIYLMSTFPSVANYRFYKLVPAIMIFMITAAAFEKQKKICAYCRKRPFHDHGGENVYGSGGALLV